MSPIKWNLCFKFGNAYLLAKAQQLSEAKQLNLLNFSRSFFDHTLLIPFPSAFIDHVLCAEDAKTGYFCKITSLLLNMPHIVLMYGECKEKLLRKFRIQRKWYPRLECESSAKWGAGPRQCKKGQGKSGND